jgi:hypothetical protein
VLRRSANTLHGVVGLRAQGRTTQQIRARCRRSSTSSEENLPISVAYRRRMLKQKRGRGNETSGRAEDSGEDDASVGAAQSAVSSVAEPAADVRAAGAVDACSATDPSAACAGRSNGLRVSIVDALAAARTAALAAKKKRITFSAGRQQPIQPESAPDKQASTIMRQRIQTVHSAWLQFREAQPHRNGSGQLRRLILSRRGSLCVTS